MRSIIICEGETDFVFLQHFMIRAHKWNDFGCGFSSSVDKSRSRDLVKNENFLTILACNGCSNIKTVFEDIIEYNQNEPTNENRYGNIVIFTDNDEEGTEAKIVKDLQNSSKQDVEIQNNKWTEVTFESMRKNKTFNINLLLLVIPFDENGTLETFLLNSIKKQDKYEADIIEKAKTFVENADPQLRYLKKRSFKIKASLYAYFSVRIEPNTNQFRQRNEIFKNIAWEEYENVQMCFKELANLG